MAVNIKKEFGSTRSRKPDLTTLVYGKIPPQAPDLEEAVIGACMIEPEAFEKASSILHAECFYVDAHQMIFQAMCELHNNSFPIDLLTVCDQLSKNNNLELIGGRYFITKISAAVISSANIETHARIVYEKFRQREIIRICGAAIGDAYEDSTDVFELQDKVTAALQELEDGIIGDNNSSRIGEIYIEVLMGIEEQKQRKSELLGVDTGYPELNAILLGLCPGDFVLLAARPSQGKTALMLNLINNAITSPISAAGEAWIYSLESSKTNLGRRYAASKNDIPLKSIRSGVLTPQQDKMLQQSIKHFNMLDIYIDDKTQNIKAIVSSIRKSHKKYMKTAKGKAGLPFIVGLDYIQLAIVDGAENDERLAISKSSKLLKRLCVELNIIIIALAQINREVTKRATDRPRPSDLAHSGQLEQDAQIIIMIHNKTSELPGGEVKVETVLIVAKNKDGNCEDVPIKFNGDIQRFINFNDMRQDAPASGITHSFHGFQTRNPSEPTVNWNDDL